MWCTGKIIITTWLFIIHQTTAKNDVNKCRLPSHTTSQIASYAPQVQTIINEATSGSFKGTTYQELAKFIDKFGPRWSGIDVLENSIDYVLNNSIACGLENVHGEPVTVPYWVRGSESATLLLPTRKDMAILGLGFSVGTPKQGITAEAIVVNSLAELKKRKAEVPGKIVVYNQECVSFLETYEYLENGTTSAAQYGAVAALIRSLTPNSLYSPHTGILSYKENITKIPGACITGEDATFLRGLAERGETIKINLKMEAQNLPDKISRNVIADLRGSTSPDKVVVISGHIDSWDIGGGAFISWQALRLLKHLNLRPRRTVRMIMWTAEEFGLLAAKQYIKAHKVDEENLQFVMESDLGTYKPLGLMVTGTDEVICILNEVMKLLAPLGKMNLTTPSVGPDIDYWTKAGVPSGTLWTNYTTLVEDPQALDNGTALLAAVSYVLADLGIDLPRHE